MEIYVCTYLPTTSRFHQDSPFSNGKSVFYDKNIHTYIHTYIDLHNVATCVL